MSIRDAVFKISHYYAPNQCLFMAKNVGPNKYHHEKEKEHVAKKCHTAVEYIECKLWHFKGESTVYNRTSCKLEHG